MTSSKTDILRKQKHRVSETSAKCRDTYCIVTRYVLTTSGTALAEPLDALERVEGEGGGGDSL
eukprot:scaffold10004_cov67-Skeletonema_dohrnii-CCMP3373.AAC.2